MSKPEIPSRGAISVVLRYGLAVVSVAVALGLALLAQLQTVPNLEFPLVLTAIAVTVWYAGAGPGVLAVVFSGLGFDYFFTQPLYTLYIEPPNRPYFIVFTLFAPMIAWFSSRRRRIEQELREARDKLEIEVAERTQQASLLNLTHDTIFVRDMSDVITYWNRGAQELYGWTAEEAIGKCAHQLLQTIFPMPIDEIRAELLRAGRWEGEFEKTKADGSQVVVASRWSLRQDERGRPIAILETNNDITERKRTEEAIHKLNEDLEKRTAELQAINKELEAFAYSISHDLLAFSRIGRAETQKTMVSLQQLVKEALSEVQQETDGRNIGWRIGALPNLYGDRSMLRLALVNLVSNAVKFTRKRPQPEIEIGSVDGKENEIVVFIRDNGVGFDMKYVNKLFGVFQRLHRAEEFEGTGIGLATVQRIIHRHGGRAWAEE